MEIKKIFARKEMKLVTLLLTSLLIASASAAVYYSLTMDAHVTVSQPALKFSQAPDQPSGSTVNDAWAHLTAKSYPNATLTYEKAVYIDNTDTLNSHSFRLAHVSIAPVNGTSDVANWDSIKFFVYDASGTPVGSLVYTVSGNNWRMQPSSGQTAYYSVPASAEWWIRMETRSPAGATLDKVCDIRISIDVQE